MCRLISVLQIICGTTLFDNILTDTDSPLMSALLVIREELKKSMIPLTIEEDITKIAEICNHPLGEQRDAKGVL